MALSDLGEKQIPVRRAPLSRVLQIDDCVSSEKLLEQMFKEYQGYKRLWKIGKHRLVEFGNTLQASRALQSFQDLQAFQATQKAKTQINKVFKFTPLEVSFADKYMIEQIEVCWYDRLDYAMHHVVMSEAVVRYKDCIPRIYTILGVCRYTKEHAILKELFVEYRKKKAANDQRIEQERRNQLERNAKRRRTSAYRCRSYYR